VLPLTHDHRGVTEIRIHPDDLESVRPEHLGWIVKRLLTGEVSPKPVVVGVTDDLIDAVVQSCGLRANEQTTFRGGGK